MISIIFFLVAVWVGYVVIPLGFKKETLEKLIEKPTDFETRSRDRSLKFLTNRMDLITPNAVTIFGLILVGVLWYLFWDGFSSKTIFWVALIAGFTDMLDGSLARNSGRETKRGAVLDVTRDVLLALVLSIALISRGLLWFQYFIWFLVGWIFLSIIRFYEFKTSNGRALSFEDDYKFALDRIRIFLYFVGIIILILTPYSVAVGMIGELMVMGAILCSWLSLIMHSAHLKLLNETAGSGFEVEEMPDEDLITGLELAGAEETEEEDFPVTF